MTTGQPGRETPHLLLQPNDPHDRGWKNRVTGVGIRLLQYVPQNTWIVSVPPDLGPTSPVLGEIRWLGTIQPQDRISSSLLREGPGAWAISADGRVKLRVSFFADVSDHRAQELLAGVGAEVLTVRSYRHTYTILLDPGRIEEDQIGKIAGL